MWMCIQSFIHELWSVVTGVWDIFVWFSHNLLTWLPSEWMIFLCVCAVGCEVLMCCLSQWCTVSPQCLSDSRICSVSCFYSLTDKSVFLLSRTCTISMSRQINTSLHPQRDSIHTRLFKSLGLFLKEVSFVH